MHLPEQPDRDGEPVTHAGESVLHSEDVVADLRGVVGVARRGELAGLEPQELADVGLGAFDPRAEHGFEPEVRADEEVGVRDQPSNSAEAVDSTGRLVEQLDDLVREGDPAGRVGRDERPVALWGSADGSSFG
ncbi:MAG: hypothetical protein R2701_00840 [Acidimicrobiales bacterium]